MHDGKKKILFSFDFIPILAILCRGAGRRGAFPCTPTQGLAGGKGAMAGGRHGVRGGERLFLGLCLTPQRWQRWAAVSWARCSTALQASHHSATPSLPSSLSSIISLSISRTVKSNWDEIHFPLTPMFFHGCFCSTLFRLLLLCYHQFLVSSAVLKPMSRLLDQPQCCPVLKERPSPHVCFCFSFFLATLYYFLLAMNIISELPVV